MIAMIVSIVLLAGSLCLMIAAIIDNSNRYEPTHPLSREQLTSFDLKAFVIHTDALDQHHRETFTTPFPKAPRRWLSHYHFTPRPLVFTKADDSTAVSVG